jgi:hypothetical protein
MPKEQDDQIEQELSTTETAPVETPPLTDEHAVDTALQLWVDSMRRSPLSRNTEAWNYLQDQVPVLSTLIKEAI